MTTTLWVSIPGAKTASSKARKNRADEFSEWRWIHWVQLVLSAVADVVVVQRAAWKAHTLRCLIVLQQPLDLSNHTNRAQCFWVKNTLQITAVHVQLDGTVGMALDMQPKIMGFNPNCCTASTATIGKSFTHLALSPKSVLWHQHKASWKRAYRTIHQPCPWWCSNGWCKADGQGIRDQRHPIGCMVWEDFTSWKNLKTDACLGFARHVKHVVVCGHGLRELDLILALANWLSLTCQPLQPYHPTMISQLTKTGSQPSFQPKLCQVGIKPYSLLLTKYK